jgi:hypothetical protein
MPIFKLNRDHTVRSLFGHVIAFKKGEDTFVPPLCVAEVVAIGAEQQDGTPDLLPPEVTPDKVLMPDEREALIMAAFEELVAKNERDAFTGSGMPTDKALEKTVGFKVDMKERNALWNKWRSAKAGE